MHYANTPCVRYFWRIILMFIQDENSRIFIIATYESSARQLLCEVSPFCRNNMNIIMAKWSLGGQKNVHMNCIYLQWSTSCCNKLQKPLFYYYCIFFVCIMPYMDTTNMQCAFVNLLCCILVQAYKLGYMYPRYLFFTIFWYSEKWWNIDIDRYGCTGKQMEELLQYSMTLEIQAYGRFIDPSLHTDTAGGLVRWFSPLLNFISYSNTQGVG